MPVSLARVKERVNDLKKRKVGLTDSLVQNPLLWLICLSVCLPSIHPSIHSFIYPLHFTTEQPPHPHPTPN
jgi:hypothetical protein